MEAAPVAWLIAFVAGAAAIFFFMQWRGLKLARVPAGPSTNDLERRLEELRGELTKSRDEVQRKQKQLEEAREEARKKLRREGKKQEREEATMTGPDPRDTEIQGLKKGLSSLESQLNATKRELEEKTAELERLRAESKGTTESASKERDALAEENAALKKTLEELRAAKRKAEQERPDVPGTSLDLKALPAEAVQELARYFRKGEEFERLYHVATGQVQLAQDRYLELQKRYFAVCRELAVAAGTKPESDEEAKQVAEGVVAGTDDARAQGSGGQAPGGQPGAQAGAPGDAPKKRRRRRRRRKGPPGEGAAAGAAGAEGAPGAESDEGADEGDEGGDEGEAGDDNEPSTSEPPASAPAP